jgi:hypothetical protein
MDACVRLLRVFIVLYTDGGLAKGSSPIQGVLSNVYMIKKLKAAKAQKRAVES